MASNKAHPSDSSQDGRSGDGAVLPSVRSVTPDEATVDRVDDPAAEHLAGTVIGLDEILASAPGPDPDGGIELTDEEFRAFLRAARS